jgi:hypothetical protein
MAAAIGFAAVVGVFLLLVWVLQRKLIYFPSDGVPRPDAVGLPSAAPVTFQTSDGLTLAGWFVRPAGRHGSPSSCSMEMAETGR